MLKDSQSLAYRKLPPRASRKLNFSHTTSGSLPEAQLIAYYLREPPPDLKSLFRNKLCRDHESRLNLSHTTSASLRRNSFQEETMQGPPRDHHEFFHWKNSTFFRTFFSKKNTWFMIFIDQISPSYRFGAKKNDASPRKS